MKINIKKEGSMNENVFKVIEEENEEKLKRDDILLLGRSIISIVDILDYQSKLERADLFTTDEIIMKMKVEVKVSAEYIPST